MRRFFYLAAVIFIAMMFSACGGGGGDDGSIDAAIENDPQNQPEPAPAPDPDDPGTVTPPPVGTLGGMLDLKDLVENRPDLDPSKGDHWYTTKVKAINDSGSIVGYSNNGSPVKAAFKWDKDTEAMVFLGIHRNFYDLADAYYADYYELKADRAIDSNGLIHSAAEDINVAGEVIGNSTTGSDEEKRAFLNRNGDFIDIPPPPYIDEEGKRAIGDFSEAVDINDRGEIVLTAEDYTGNKHAYYWDGGSFITVTFEREENEPVEVTMPHLMPLGGVIGEASRAVAINENSHAVVNTETSVVFHDMNWGVIEVLNHLPGADLTVAVDINDSSYVNHDGISDAHIIGNSGTGFDPNNIEITEDDVQGFFWDGGAMYPVNHLGGGTSVVTDLNNKDQVVGSATTTDGAVHAFLWTLVDKKGVITDLGTLGGENSYAVAINESGEVVGYSETGEFYEEEGVLLPIRHAFFWKEGVMYDLGTHDDFYDYAFIPPYPFSEATAINNNSEIAGNSITINAHYRGFYLEPLLPVDDQEEISQ